MTPKELKRVTDACRERLPLEGAALPDEYYYASLPICVIDAVFSIRANYDLHTRPTVIRFCQYFGLERTAKVRIPQSKQLSIARFLQYYATYGINGMADRVYQNQQRTSSRGGILKSDAVKRWSQVLQKHGVQYLQDVSKIVGNPPFEEGICAIPGQGSTVSLRYFYMLSGSDDFVKPDTRINDFLFSVLSKRLTVEECHEAVVGACKILVQDFSNLTPRLLDHLIWDYQRKQ